MSGLRFADSWKDLSNPVGKGGRDKSLCAKGGGSQGMCAAVREIHPWGRKSCFTGTRGYRAGSQDPSMAKAGRDLDIPLPPTPARSGDIFYKETLNYLWGPFSSHEWGNCAGKKPNLSTCSSKYCCFWVLWCNLNEDSSLSHQPHQGMTSQETTSEQKIPFLHKSNVQHGCVTGRSQSLQLFLVDIAQYIYRFQ